jgi:hypothetical protein
MSYPHRVLDAWLAIALLATATIGCARSDLPGKSPITDAAVDLTALAYADLSQAHSADGDGNQRGGETVSPGADTGQLPVDASPSGSDASPSGSDASASGSEDASTDARQVPTPDAYVLACEGIVNASARVCCAGSCGTCGGDGCSDRPGGATSCCTSTILSSATSCERSDPPCIFPDPQCTSGILSPAGDVCCTASCGTCGGDGCNSRPGGAEQCCRNAIASAGQRCELLGPPCVMPTESSAQ